MHIMTPQTSFQMPFLLARPVLDKEPGEFGWTVLHAQAMKGC